MNETTPDSLLLLNGMTVNEGERREADIFVKHGRIEAIGPDLSSRAADVTLDVSGCLVLPGMIDDQVHFREPGFPHKADIASESRAAVTGGITSFMEMPNTNPKTITAEALADKYARGARSSLANYSFYFGATNENLDEIKRIDPKQTPGLKVFMGASTGDMLVDDPEVLDAIFRECPTRIITHCEDTPMIRANEAAAKAKYGDDIPVTIHHEIRSTEACFKSSSFAVDLARRTGARLHVLHLTTEKELELFTPGPLKDKQITVEVCAHHLFFNADQYETLGPRIKCNPAIKLETDRLALLNAVAEDRIDIIATDHAPHTLEEKDNPYFQSPAGLPLVDFVLPAVLEHVHRGALTVEQVVKKTAHAPAELFNVVERGYLREGYWADIAVVDMNADYEVTDEDSRCKCAWTPFAGFRLHSQVVATIVSGHLAWYQDYLNDSVLGQRLEFQPGQ